MGGYLDHYETTAWGRTRMTPAPQTYDTSYWNYRTLGWCDEARLQLMYDLYDKSADYSTCLDHIPNAVAGVGLVTDLTASPTSTTVCSGQTVTVSGRSQVHDYSSYGKLKNNGLWGRLITIKRSGSIYAYVEVASGSGNNWSLMESINTSVTVTYNYTAQYVSAGFEGLASSPLRSFSITWVKPAEC